ncbi:MAG: hypothetical protein HYU87_11925 [Chloroflexi bacterium]|nr:hypothetical protein [Chloroflexota bacterium]
MSDDRDLDRTEPIDQVPEPEAATRRSGSHWLGNAIAILLVLAVGGLMAAGAVRSFVPTLRGAAGATPSPSATAAPSPSFTLRPLPTFTATPTPSPTPTALPTPTRAPTPTPRATPTQTPRPATSTPIRTTPRPSPTK